MLCQEQFNENNALGISSKIMSGQLDMRALGEFSFRKCKEANSKLNCFVSLLSDGEFNRLINENLSANSNLAGNLIAVKDNICTSNLPTTAASGMLNGFMSQYDATVIKKLINAGLLIVGKTNMDEFAMGSDTKTSFYGCVKNPFNPKYTCGGSSGGSAAIIASKALKLALGSDTGGSIRQPCSYLNLVGLKPSYGTVSRYGLIAYASSLDQIGPMGQRLMDVAALYNVIAGFDELDYTTIDKMDFRVDLNEIDGFCGKIPNGNREFKLCMLSELVTDETQKCADLYAQKGIKTDTISLPFILKASQIYYIIACSEAASNLSRYDGIRYGESSDDVRKLRSSFFGDEVKKRIIIGNYCLSEGLYDDLYKKADTLRHKLTDILNQILDKYDAILLPVVMKDPSKANSFVSATSEPVASAPTPNDMATSALVASAPTPNDIVPPNALKPDLTTVYRADTASVIANLTGFPALAFPCQQLGEQGFTRGVQLMSKKFNEQILFNLANVIMSERYKTEGQN